MSKQKHKIKRCTECEMMTINGHPTHETGCPNAWRDVKRECKWCGSEFYPSERHQVCCSSECVNAYYGLVGEDL